VLPDNSRVTLDAATRLTAAYTPEARQIDLLSGQAFFDVAKDPGRPFRVTAGDQTVVAVGTAFNVEYVDSAIVVTLVEGEVVVTEGPAVTPALVTDDGADPAAPVNSVKLVAGQQLVAPRDAEAEITASPNLDKSTSWRRGRIIFEEDTLEAAVERVNRYSRIRVVIADPALRDLRIGGVFNAGDTEAFLDAVEAAFPVEARRMTASEIELHAAGE
jgi:transmembrane sensor